MRTYYVTIKTVFGFKHEVGSTSFICSTTTTEKIIRFELLTPLSLFGDLVLFCHVFWSPSRKQFPIFERFYGCFVQQKFDGLEKYRWKFAQRQSPIIINRLLDFFHKFAAHNWGSSAPLIIMYKRYHLCTLWFSDFLLSLFYPESICLGILPGKEFLTSNWSRLEGEESSIAARRGIENIYIKGSNSVACSSAYLRAKIQNWNTTNRKVTSEQNW